MAVLLGVFGVWKGRETPIGDTQAGVPELRADSRYNRDSNIITSKFSIGVDILNVIVETKEPACTSHELMTAIDNFSWDMRNVDGVQEVLSLPLVAKIAIAGWNEGSLKWRNIPREPNQLTQSTRYIETSTGLLNADCNVVPVMMFLRDHKAETIERVVAAVKEWRTQNTFANASFNLATGNVGVMAATNEEVKAKEYPILGWVFAAVILMCLLTFRSLLGHGAGVPAAGAGVGAGLRGHGHRRHRPQGEHAAHGGARRRHRRRLRHLPVEPHAGVPERPATASTTPTSRPCA